MPIGDRLEEAGWGYGGHDRVLHWYEPEGSLRWRSLCGKVLGWSNPGDGKSQFLSRLRCRTCTKKLKAKEETCSS